MQPLPPERRWTVEWPDGATVVIERHGDSWSYVGGGDPDDFDSAAGRVTAGVRLGWPWMPGFSLPRTGFHEEMGAQLGYLGAIVTVDPPFPDVPTLDDPNTIVG